ncbi:unnamed protein product [Blepharisma stoltei]|uniref:Reverse transcriptase domain-containing protein n=1 Tax=Blepharisma stoltei TaxID=1481888 RepID=A0AAU9K3Y5_9CILI|nr:unnamed protein product [Blepharisma stoltei]
MPNMSTGDQIFALDTILAHSRKKKKGLVCAFLDISKAFDSVRHADIYRTMRDRGISSDSIGMLQAMYYEGRSRIIVNEHLTEQIDIKKGVRQGGISSPLCFNFIPDVLARKIDESNLGIRLRKNGPRIGILLYADDIVLIARNIGHLQLLCDITCAWAYEFSLSINIAKSIWIDYRKKLTDQSLRLGGLKLERVDKFKCLGKFTEKRLEKKTDQKLTLEKMKTACRAVQGINSGLKSLPIVRRAVIAEAHTVSTALYAKECMQSDWDQKLLDLLERERMKIARTLLNAPKGIARETSLEDLGWITIRNHWRKRVLTFRKRVLGSRSVIMKEIVRANRDEELPWERNCTSLLNQFELNEFLDKERITSLEKRKWELMLTNKVSALNLKEVLHRLKTETERTTRLWRWLKDGATFSFIPTFMRFNLDRQLAAGAIHRLRAGFNYSNYNAYIRHLVPSGKCGTCDVDETEEHMLEVCPRFGPLRARLEKELEQLQVPLRQFRLMEITLYGNRFEEFLKTLEEERGVALIADIDRHIKMFHEGILKAKMKELEAKKGATATGATEGKVNRQKSLDSWIITKNP